MKFAIFLCVFSPVIIGIAIIFALVIAEVKYKKESRYIDNLLDRCIEAKGHAFVRKTLEMAKNSLIGVKQAVKLLEASCDAEQNNQG